MLAASQLDRHSYRDATMILMAYRHGLRVSELVMLKWSQIDLTQGILHVNRLKNGMNTVHPLFGKEIRALRKLQREYPETQYVCDREERTDDSIYL